MASHSAWTDGRRLLALAVATSIVLHATALLFGPQLRHVHPLEAPPLKVEILLPPKVIPPAVEPDPAPAPKPVPVARPVAQPPGPEPALALPQPEETSAVVIASAANHKAEAPSTASEGHSEPPQQARAATPNDSVPSAAVTPLGLNPAYLRNPAPRYPASALRRGQEGIVMLKVLVATDGSASRVELEKSSGAEALDNAAREAVNGWRFVPARRGADPVEAWVVVPVVFKLEGRG